MNDDDRPDDDEKPDLIKRLADAGLTVAEGAALMDEALLIRSMGEDLAAVAWSTANRLLVADPADRMGARWLALHEWVSLKSPPADPASPSAPSD